MGNLAFVLCQGGIQEPIKKNGIIKRCILLYKRIFVKSIQKIEIANFEVFENVSLFTINLPCKIEDLGMLNKRDIEKFFTGFIIQNSISSCIIPDSLMGKLNFQNCIRNLFDSRCLYFSLLRNIIEIVYKNKKKNPYELDITIISGDNNDNLRALIEYIAPHIKYLTVVKSAKQKETLDIDELLNDYGLSARVTDNIKSALKNAQIVVNLAEIDDDLLSNLRVSPDCTIINYGKVAGKGFREGLMINGINVSLPPTIYKNLDKRIIDYFTSAELSEMFISHKLSIEDKIKAGQINCVHMNKILKEFTANKFAVNSFNGRHGLINVKEF